MPTLKTKFAIHLALGVCFIATPLIAENYAEPYLFTTLAGVASEGSADGTGADARFFKPTGVAADREGNLYVADTINHTIRKITPAGVVTTLAGAPGIIGSQDGAGPDARFFLPTGVACASGAPFGVYVADRDNHTIRWISPIGTVSTFAGSAGQPGSADGPGLTARFRDPYGLTVSVDGKIYVADTGNHTIRVMATARDYDNLTTHVSTLAGNPGVSGFADGVGSEIRFYEPMGIAVSGVSLFVSDSGNGRVRKGHVTGRDFLTIQSGSDLRQLASDSITGGIYAAESGHRVIWRLDPDGALTQFGNSAESGHVDGIGLAVRFNYPEGVATDANGTVYVGDTDNNVIRRITSDGTVSTFAGLSPTEAAGSADGKGADARFSFATGIAVNESGMVYVSDRENHTIRRIEPDGTVTTFAGMAGVYGSSDGNGSSARFRYPQGLALDEVGNLYVADSMNCTIRRITPDGTVSTLAGSPFQTGMIDGTGTAARFNRPCGVAVGSDGNLYVADTDNHTIRRITPEGVVTTIAGAPGLSGYTDGPGMAARFIYPFYIAADSAGNLYVSESSRNYLRRITNGMVATVAVKAAAQPFEFSPRGVAADSVGNVYVANGSDYIVQKISTTGEVTTIGGLANSPGNADGLGNEARFSLATGLAIDTTGVLYITDRTVVRKGTSTSPPVILAHPQSQSVSLGAGVTLTVTATGVPAPTLQWYHNANPIAGATTTSLVLPSVQLSDAGDYTVAVTNSLASVTSVAAKLTVNNPTPPPIGGTGSKSGSSGGGASGLGFISSLALLSIVRVLLRWRRAG